MRDKMYLFWIILSWGGILAAALGGSAHGAEHLAVAAQQAERRSCVGNVVEQCYAHADADGALRTCVATGVSTCEAAYQRARAPRAADGKGAQTPGRSRS